MVHSVKGIVLRSVKYGETSLITTIFTRTYGIQSFMVQGVRSAKAKTSKAALLQPSTLLDLVIYHKPNANLQRIKEMQPAYIYKHMQEEVVSNSIALFSVEVLLRLLPEQAPQPELFDLAMDYFMALDQMPARTTGNFPLYFLIQTSQLMGYELQGKFCAQTPHLDLQEGGYTHHTPMLAPYVSPECTRLLDAVTRAADYAALQEVKMNSEQRTELLEWYLAFLQRHTQHFGTVRSLQVLKAVLH